MELDSSFQHTNLARVPVEMIDDMLANFTSITGCDTDKAREYLRRHDWNMEAAVEEALNADAHHGTDEQLELQASRARGSGDASAAAMAPPCSVRLEPSVPARNSSEQNRIVAAKRASMRTANPASSAPVRQVSTRSSVSSEAEGEEDGVEEERRLPKVQKREMPQPAVDDPRGALWVRAACGRKVALVRGGVTRAHTEPWFEEMHASEESPLATPFHAEVLEWVADACKRLGWTIGSQIYRPDFGRLSDLRLLDAYLAARYLHLDQLCAALGEHINLRMRGKTSSELVEAFGFEDDLSDAEKRVVSSEALFTEADAPGAAVGQVGAVGATRVEAAGEHGPEQVPPTVKKLLSSIDDLGNGELHEMLAQCFDLTTLHALKGCSHKWLRRSRIALCHWRDKLRSLSTHHELNLHLAKLQGAADSVDVSPLVRMLQERLSGGSISYQINNATSGPGPLMREAYVQGLKHLGVVVVVDAHGQVIT